MLEATALLFVLEGGASKIAVYLMVSCFTHRRMSIMSDLNCVLTF